MTYMPADIGDLVKLTRKQQRLTQSDLALTSGTGIRFIIDLEKGKETCQLGKVLLVLRTLGINLVLTPPSEIPDAPSTLSPTPKPGQDARA